MTRILFSLSIVLSRSLLAILLLSALVVFFCACAGLLGNFDDIDAWDSFFIGFADEIMHFEQTEPSVFELLQASVLFFSLQFEGFADDLHDLR